jgi:signal transduction histidine kinase
MTSFFIEKFYQFFEGFMIFQVLFFGMIFFVSKRKDVLLYALLNLITATYFFLNAPDTFMGIDENIVFDSPLYLYINFAILLCMQLTYLIFLKEIFIETVEKFPYIKRVYTLTIYFIVFLYLLFVLVGLSGWNTQFLFYLGHLPNATFATIIVMLNLKVKGYKSLMIYATIVTFICVTLTLIFTIRYNAHYTNIFLDKYPLFPVRIGMLIDVILFQLTLLKRWNEQEKQLAIKQIQQQLAIEKVRNQISSQLHDDMGSTLSGISMYSHLTDKQMSNSEFDNAKASLQVIQKSTDEMVDKLGDLVWSVNPKQDSLALLFERLDHFGSQMCAAKSIAFTCKIPTNITEMNIPHEHRHQVYLMLKEAINNAVKYSAATAIKFEASLANAVLTIVVADNGKGFDADNILKGNGLDGMQKRAEEMGAEYLLQASPKKGTSVSVRLKIPQ